MILHFDQTPEDRSGHVMWITKLLNEKAKVYGQPELSPRLAGLLLEHVFCWRCSECGRLHSTANKLFLVHVFGLAGEVGQNVISNVRPVCQRCRLRQQADDDLMRRLVQRRHPVYTLQPMAA